MEEGGDLNTLETEATTNLNAEGTSPEDARAAANTPDDTAAGSLGMDPKTLMLLGGAAIALVFLMKKKK